MAGAASTRMCLISRFSCARASPPQCVALGTWLATASLRRVHLIGCAGLGLAACSNKNSFAKLLLIARRYCHPSCLVPHLVASANQGDRGKRVGYNNQRSWSAREREREAQVFQSEFTYSLICVDASEIQSQVKREKKAAGRGEKETESESESESESEKEAAGKAKPNHSEENENENENSNPTTITNLQRAARLTLYIGVHASSSPCRLSLSRVVCDSAS